MFDPEENYVLAQGVKFVPTNKLTPQQRRGIECGANDRVIMRPRSRKKGVAVSSEMFELISLFRDPSSLKQILLVQSGRRELSNDFQKELKEILALLIQKSFLVLPDSPERDALKFSLSAGDSFAGWKIIEPARINYSSEYYEAQKSGSDELGLLKILRSSASADEAKKLTNEIRVLRCLSGEGGPALLAEGQENGQAYLVASWFEGEPIVRWARQVREGSQDYDLIFRTALNMLRTYEVLHSKNVIHTDIQGANVLVNADLESLIVDFESAAIGEQDKHSGRRHVLFLAPELALERQKKSAASESTLAAEVYALAALMTVIMVGERHIAFDLDNSQRMKEILTKKPRRLYELGLEGWGGVGDVIFKALSEHPEDRYGSVQEFRLALEAAYAARP